MRGHWTKKAPQCEGHYWMCNEFGDYLSAKEFTHRRGRWWVADDYWSGYDGWAGDGWLRWSEPIKPPKSKKGK